MIRINLNFFIQVSYEGLGKETGSNIIELSEYGYYLMNAKRRMARMAPDPDGRSK